MATKSGALLLTDDAIFPVRAGLSAMKNLGSEMVLEDEDVAVVTQCGSLGGKLPIESGSLDVVVSVWKVAELIGGQWLQEIGRVLKPGGRIVVQIPLLSTEEDKLKSTLERKILVSGFLEVQALEQESLDAQSIIIKGKKPTWTMGSSFPIKKAVKTVPKIQIEDESDLIDEDSLLTEEDLMKPQLPPVGDCEVGSTRKACKNCACGRAEAEEKVQKLGLTAEQINNPQSACGNCGLGDAFRCSGCSYRGLPPFKLGEKVSLPGGFLVADV